MGKLDYKSMLVGVLCITCFLLLIGQRSDGSFGNIVVESITIKGDNDEGSFVSIENRDGEEILYLGEAVSTGGILQIFNKDGSQVLYGGTAEGGVGIITTYDATEKMTTYIGASGDNDGGLLSVMDENENVAVQITSHTGGGYIRTYSDGLRNSYLGSMESGDSGFALMYKNGDIYYEKTAE